jgi:glycosyltransferase involved in cell wall biosynthesis
LADNFANTGFLNLPWTPAYFSRFDLVLLAAICHDGCLCPALASGGLPASANGSISDENPVRGSDIRGCREAVLHNANGLLVPLHDDWAMADAIVELLTDRERARCLGEEGCRLALERFDERLVFDKVKAGYARLLREKGRSAPELQSLTMQASA